MTLDTLLISGQGAYYRKAFYSRSTETFQWNCKSYAGWTGLRLSITTSNKAESV